MVFAERRQQAVPLVEIVHVFPEADLLRREPAAGFLAGVSRLASAWGGGGEGGLGGGGCGRDATTVARLTTSRSLVMVAGFVALVVRGSRRPLLAVS